MDTVGPVPVVKADVETVGPVPVVWVGPVPVVWLGPVPVVGLCLVTVVNGVNVSETADVGSVGVNVDSVLPVAMLVGGGEPKKIIHIIIFFCFR